MAADNVPEYSVSELSGQVKRTIEDAYGYVRVRGELGRVTRAGSGHVYLDLKDERACLSSVMWKGTAQRQSMRPEQGMEVVATGRMSTFPGQSRYQLIIDTLAPAGAGALMALYEERKKKLTAEGLFAPERKRPLPRLPSIIGVVTSPSGAVIRDILHRLRDRYPSHVIVWPTLVQGESAAAGIVRGIEGLAKLPSGKRPDVVIVARGGGSLEDLWCFNDEAVARAAAASPIPLISAVGHETDTTLIDFAADVRAPTPTAAAEIAVPVRLELVSQVDQAGSRLERRVDALLEGARLSLRSAERGLGAPQALIAAPEQRLDLAEERLAGAARRMMEGRDAALGRLVPRLQESLLFRPVEKREADLERRGTRLRDGARRTADRSERRLGQLSPRFSPEVLRQRFEGLAGRFASLEGRLGVCTSQGIKAQEDRLARLRLPAGLVRSLLSAHRASVEQAGRLLVSLSYRGVLERGFALVTDREGVVVKSAASARKADALRLTFADGTHETGPSGPAPKGKKTKPEKDVQQGLF